MIGKLVGSKLMPWLSGGLIVLILALLAAVYALHSRNGLLSERLGNLNQENAQLAESIRQQSAQYQNLSRELQRRDALVIQAQQARQIAERDAREQIETLRQALATDECAGTDHPAAVTHSLRPRATDSVQD